MPAVLPNVDGIDSLGLRWNGHVWAVKKSCARCDKQVELPEHRAVPSLIVLSLLYFLSLSRVMIGLGWCFVCASRSMQVVTG